jgi:hypothetical protein
MSWVRLVVQMRERRGTDWVWVGKPEGRGRWEDLGLDGRTVLKCIFNNWVGGMDWIELALAGPCIII